MKNKLNIIIAFLLVGIFTSCNVIVNHDTTGNISMVSTKPVMTLLGEPIMSLKNGETYNESGVDAVAGDTILDWEIVSGNVDVNQDGFYVVTYEAKNGFGWASQVYRAVLVHDGTPYSTDIAGLCEVGFLFDSYITKHQKNGYWKIDNVWAEEGVVFPVVFADYGNGVNYGVVPGEHETKGRYTGIAVKSGNVLKFTLNLVSPQGTETTKDFEWALRY